VVVEGGDGAYALLALVAMIVSYWGTPFTVETFHSGFRIGHRKRGMPIHASVTADFADYVPGRCRNCIPDA
jgi:hypothetical protein